MALNFTDDQLRELTGKVLAAPDIIASLVQDKGKAIDKKNGYLDVDNANKVYTDNFDAIIDAYNNEIKYLDGLTRADYSPALIEAAGKLAPGNVHFPESPIWVNFPPKLIPSNQGLPTSAFPTTENSVFALINPKLNLLKNGWTDGSNSDTTATSFVANKVEVTTGGFSVGQKVIFIDGSNFLYGTIASVNTPPAIVGTQTLEIITIYGDSSGISTGATVKNFHPGWNLTQRDSGTGASLGDSAFMAAQKAGIDPDPATWKTYLQAEKAALASNDAIGPEKAQIQAATALVDSHIATITTWQGYPDIGVGTSRFGTNLPALETAIAARPGEITSRISEITAAYGSVNQAGDGTYTGSGQYFNFFDNLNMRVNKTSGSLRNFYQMDLIISVFDEQIAQAQAQADRDNATFNIKTFTANADGTNIVKVNNVTGLVIGESVKIMSNALPVIDAQITDITGLDVELSVTIPNTYLISDKARLVKLN